MFFSPNKQATISSTTFSSRFKKKLTKGKVISLQARCGPEVGRGIALLFHDRGTRRGWVVSSMPRPHFTPGKEPVPILQEAEWAPGPVWTSGKSSPHRDSIPDRPARSQSLYRLSYPAHKKTKQLFVIQSGAKRTHVFELPAISFFGVTSNQKSTFENLVQSTIWKFPFAKKL